MAGGGCAPPADLFVGNPRVGRVNTKSRCQRDQMILFLDEDAAQTFRDGKFVQFVRLFDPAAIVGIVSFSFSRSNFSISSAFSEVLTGFGATEGIPPR